MARKNKTNNTVSIVLGIAGTLAVIVLLMTLVKNSSNGPNVTVRGHRSSLCKQAQDALSRCSGQRSNDILKTCATYLERVHRECPN
ncbi:MAG: hypothetical protein ACPGQS_14840 [Bradymonadia bacterium]